MCPKSVPDGHATRDAAHLHATFNAFERVERGLDLFVRKPAVFRGRDDSQRVSHIQFADKIQMKLKTRNFKFCCRRAVTDIESMNRIIFAKTKSFHRAMCDVQEWRKIQIIAVAEQK